MTERGFRRLSIAVLGYTVAVILWGAYVRAVKAGNGCGSHWPTCNGEIVPLGASTKTLIEFTHRITSGLALIAVLLQAWFAFRVYPVGSPPRRGAMASVFFMLTEAAVGGSLVLLEYVAENASIGRAWFMGIHLMNTFLLLASMTLTVFWAHGGGRLRWAGQGLIGGLLAVTLVGVLVLGISGAIAALGDTLFPARSLAEGLSQDASATAHVFLRLRKWHPIFALLVAVGVVASAMMTASERPTSGVRKAAALLGGAFVCQLILGVTNLVLLAPVPIQLVHLLTADVVWIALVMLTAAALQPRET